MKMQHNQIIYTACNNKNMVKIRKCNILVIRNYNLKQTILFKYQKKVKFWLIFNFSASSHRGKGGSLSSSDPASMAPFINTNTTTS